MIQLSINLQNWHKRFPYFDYPWLIFDKNLTIKTKFFSDPILHSSNGERSDIRTLLQKLILEEDQFAVQDILPNTVPDPASLVLTSEYACPIGQVVQVPDCGECLFFLSIKF